VLMAERSSQPRSRTGRPSQVRYTYRCESERGSAPAAGIRHAAGSIGSGWALGGPKRSRRSSPPGLCSTASRIVLGLAGLLGRRSSWATGRTTCSCTMITLPNHCSKFARRSRTPRPRSSWNGCAARSTLTDRGFWPSRASRTMSSGHSRRCRRRVRLTAWCFASATGQGDICGPPPWTTSPFDMSATRVRLRDPLARGGPGSSGAGRPSVHCCQHDLSRTRRPAG